jgi:hypothetical protein
MRRRLRNDKREPDNLIPFRLFLGITVVIFTKGALCDE